MPIVAAVNESKKAKNKGKPQVSSRPFYIDMEETSELENSLQTDPAPKPKIVEEPKKEVKLKPIVLQEEEPAKEHFSKKLTEAQKLVIYSEIMSPKFEK